MRLMLSKQSTTTKSKPRGGRFAMFAASAVVVTVLGTTGVGVVSAQSNGNNDNNNDNNGNSQQLRPKTQADCNKWQSYDFDNKADCLKWLANHPDHGHGYGGEDNQNIRNVLQQVIALLRSLFASLFH